MPNGTPGPATVPGKGRFSTFGVLLRHTNQFVEDGFAAILSAAKHSKAGAYVFQIQGAHHFNFTDMDTGFYAPMQLMSLLGSIASSRTTEIARAYHHCFFDHYLKGTPAGCLLENDPAHPEVKVLWRHDMGQSETRSIVK
jgi:hypothetical protein